MHVLSRISTLCVAGLLIADFTTANPVTQPQGKDKEKDRLAGMLPKDINRGKCTTPNKYDTPEQRKQAWIDANGWNLTDEFMNRNSANEWAQSMMQSIFPDVDASSFACSDRDAQCINSKGCDDFEEKGWPGAFYIVSSMKNVHTYFSAYLTKMDEMNEQLKTDVDSLVKLFGKDVPVAKNLNIAALFAGALGLASGITAPVAPISGFLGASSGIAAISGNIFKKEPKTLPQIQDDAAVILKEVIQGYVNAAKGQANLIMDSMFGKGPGEDVIPKEMKFNLGENTDGWVHAITYVLGDGQWLSNDPIKSMELDHLFEETRRKLRQSIAFQLVRLLHGAVVVINNVEEWNEDKCRNKGDGNQAWDPVNKWCYGMMWLQGGRLKGGINDYAFPLWKPENEGGFGMDKEWTYRNAFHCWTSNGNRLGDIVMDDITPGTSLPRCMFSMEMKKGKWVDNNNDCWSGQTIQLDKQFPNFPKGEWEGRSNWPQEKPTLSLFCANKE